MKVQTQRNSTSVRTSTRLRAQPLLHARLYIQTHMPQDYVHLPTRRPLNGDSPPSSVLRVPPPRSYRRWTRPTSIITSAGRPGACTPQILRADRRATCGGDSLTRNLPQRTRTQTWRPERTMTASPCRLAWRGTYGGWTPRATCGDIEAADGLSPIPFHSSSAWFFAPWRRVRLAKEGRINGKKFAQTRTQSTKSLRFRVFSDYPCQI